MASRKQGENHANACVAAGRREPRPVRQPGARAGAQIKRVDDQRRILRYDTLVATFIAVLAVGVSAYTAHVQRQQVRAQDALFARVNKERFRVGVEICFYSTLGDCWTLAAPAKQPARTDEVGSCPKASASTFRR
jgi:hypothetical protein